MSDSLMRLVSQAVSRGSQPAGAGAGATAAAGDSSGGAAGSAGDFQSAMADLLAQDPATVADGSLPQTPADDTQVADGAESDKDAPTPMGLLVQALLGLSQQVQGQPIDLPETIDPRNPAQVAQIVRRILNTGATSEQHAEPAMNHAALQEVSVGAEAPVDTQVATEPRVVAEPKTAPEADRPDAWRPANQPAPQIAATPKVNSTEAAVTQTATRINATPEIAQPTPSDQDDVAVLSLVAVPAERPRPDASAVDWQIEAAPVPLQRGADRPSQPIEPDATG
ncbi:MAG: hypothetical protein PHU85_13190, partial [Phycisphaerae bacterium]|nr:hypothetical protein [Phycisphaerae bacterium]